MRCLIWSEEIQGVHKIWYSNILEDSRGRSNVKCSKNVTLYWSGQMKTQIQIQIQINTETDTDTHVDIDRDVIQIELMHVALFWGKEEYRKYILHFKVSHERGERR